MPPYFPKTPAWQRVLRRCVEDSNGCWTWTGATRPDGYFQMAEMDGTQPPGHRVVYEYFRGEIPEGLVLDHLCYVRNCVNPWHLEPVTQYVNVHRSDSPWAVNARKTHCNSGHELAGDNLYLMPNTGYRACRECRRAAERRWRARKKGLAA
jgi:hypothetical protein